MHQLNTIEKEYTFEELKQDWFFKLFYKFLKHHHLYNKILTERPSTTIDGVNMVISTFHSNNYCISKLFFGTISCSLRFMSLQECSVFDFEWSKYMKDYLGFVPEDIQKTIEITQHKTFKQWFEEYYNKEYERYNRLTL